MRLPLCLALLTRCGVASHEHGHRLAGAHRCEQWCTTHHNPWRDKCTWDECTRCSSCSEGGGGGGGNGGGGGHGGGTHVSVSGEEFHINGQPTYRGVHWKGKSMQGLLMNSRMVNAIFDDVNTLERNPWGDHDPHKIWGYQDTGRWDADRNTNEFVDSLYEYAQAGLNAVTVSIQGGSPCGNNPSDHKAPCGNDMYNRDSSGFARDGSLRQPFFDRLERILRGADEQGIVVILQFFYPDMAFQLFKPSHGGGGDTAIQRAADNTVDWLLRQGRKNVMVDVCNECDIQGAHDAASWLRGAPPQIAS